ncbi:hypothetical protein DSO57_1023152 [Entomophthora muscae]|uniref:Uncharacterized protein n=1 Tax=Entomophthora muscae TaxID=34485 RepID=A0ACC2RUA3_9FUNG|nr:hypothetical protein DSO57_1023152 [Entomophthora muscae]
MSPISVQESWMSLTKDPVQLPFANLTALPIHVSRGKVVGYDKLLNAPDVLSLHSFGTPQDFNLPEDKLQVLSLFTAQDFLQLSTLQQNEVIDLLDQFLDILAKDSTDYCQNRRLNPPTRF